MHLEDQRRNDYSAIICTVCAALVLAITSSAFAAVAQDAQSSKPDIPKSGKTGHQESFAPGKNFEKHLCGLRANKERAIIRLKNFRSAVRRGQEIRILAIGSSSTWGTGASHPTQSYPAQLQRLLTKRWPGSTWRIINSGIPGEKAAGSAARLISFANTNKPQLVLWQLGTNDAIARVPVHQFLQTVSSTLAFMKKLSVDIILIGMQYSPKWAHDVHYAAIRNTLLNVSRSNALPLVQRFKPMQQVASRRPIKDYLAKDRFHLNDLGYTCLALRVAATISDALSAASRP